MNAIHSDQESKDMQDFAVQGPWEESLVRRTWFPVIADLGLQGGTLHFSQKAPDFGRAVYIDGPHVYKIVLAGLDISRHARANDTTAEFNILRKCAGVRGIPVAVELKRAPAYTALVLEKIDAIPASELGVRPLKKIVISIKLIPLVIKLAARRVNHNDINLENVLVTSRNRIGLIDFDQATEASPIAALRAMLVGQPIGGQTPHGCVYGLVKHAFFDLRRAAMQVLPAPLRRKVMEFREKRDPLPRVPAHSAAALVREAWEIGQNSNASSPGLRKAYYLYKYGGFSFPGERPWKFRWDTLRKITPLGGRRILELGCNMALLSIHALAEENAEAALAVDADPDILRAASLIASAHGVKPSLARVDFDSSEDWEAELKRFRPDVVFALNVLNWVRQKDRFLRFLGNFSTIVFEGHDSFEVECRRLREVGFSDIRLVGYSERNRPLMRCAK